MYHQNQKIGIVNKLIIGSMTVVLFVAGLLASLLALAIGGAMVLFILAKVWWIRRRTEKTCLDAEYHVIRE